MMLIPIWFQLAEKPETWGEFLLCPMALPVALAGTLLGRSGGADVAPAAGRGTFPPGIAQPFHCIQDHCKTQTKTLGLN